MKAKHVLILAAMLITAALAVMVSASQYSLPTFANASKPLATVDDGAATPSTIAGRDSSGNSPFNVITANAGVVDNGYLALNVLSESANYGMTGAENVIEMNASGGARTCTLPVASTVTGRRFMLIKVDSSGNAVSWAPNGSDDINGANTAISLGSQWAKAVVISDGTEFIREQ